MRRWTMLATVAVLFVCTVPALALNSGTDVLVPAAARGEGSAGSMWVTDLYILNLGDDQASVTLYWLERDQANPSPAAETFTVLAGETLVLEDVIQTVFGASAAGGAFRVMADQELAVNSRIYNLKDGVTFGQGFPGIPRAAALAAGDATDVVGLAHNDAFRTNVVLMDASGDGASVTLSLRDVSGMELASGSFTLAGYEPQLFTIANLDASLDFDQGTLHAEVTSGSALVLASKVDNDTATGDPTTLEAWMPLGGGSGSVDGTYQLAIYDQTDWPTGGQLVVADGMVEIMDGTYTNWWKDGDPSDPACDSIFRWGGEFEEPIPLADFATGVTWTESYPNSGTIEWTITFTMDGTLGLVGSVDAEGSDFPTAPIDLTGCEGVFPTQTLRGGKAE